MSPANAAKHLPNMEQHSESTYYATSTPNYFSSLNQKYHMITNLIQTQEDKEMVTQAFDAIHKNLLQLKQNKMQVGEGMKSLPETGKKQDNKRKKPAGSPSTWKGSKR